MPCSKIHAIFLFPCHCLCALLDMLSQLLSGSQSCYVSHVYIYKLVFLMSASNLMEHAIAVYMFFLFAHVISDVY